MSDEALFENEKNSNNNRRLIILVVVMVLFACCCISFSAAGWFLGDSVLEFLCEQAGVGCL